MISSLTDLTSVSIILIGFVFVDGKYNVNSKKNSSINQNDNKIIIIINYNNNKNNNNNHTYLAIFKVNPREIR